MDLVDEEDVLFAQVGQRPHEIARLCERRRGRRLNVDQKLRRDGVSARRLEKPWRTIEDRLNQWLVACDGSIDRQAQVVLHFLLPDELLQPLRTEGELNERLVRQDFRRGDLWAGHCSYSTHGSDARPRIWPTPILPKEHRSASCEERRMRSSYDRPLPDSAMRRLMPVAPRRLRFRTPVLLATAAAGALGGCTIPTDAPVTDTRWVVPAQTTRIAVDKYLPSGLTVAPDSSGFLVSVPGATVTRTLGQDCAQCTAANGLTAPKPAFVGSPSISTSGPTDLVSAAINGGAP